MLETLSSIFFYSTLIVDLLSTITLCAFTALIFTKVEVSAALEEKCDTCKTHLLFMKCISVSVTIIFAVNFAFNESWNIDIWFSSKWFASLSV